MIPTDLRCLRHAVLGAILALVVGSGCQFKQIAVEGTTATQEDNFVLLDGGPHEGSWEDANIITSFTYNNESDGFEFDGIVELTSRLDMTFRTVRSFSVRANFMDAEKKILRSVVIVNAGNQAIRLWRFTQNIDMPPEVKMLNFSYSGRAMEGGSKGPGGDGTDTFFWRVP